MLLKYFVNFPVRFFFIAISCMFLCELIPGFSYVLCLFVICLSVYDIVKTQKYRIQSYILWCIIIVIIEVVSRISGSSVAYEFGKYSVILLSIVLMVLNSIRPLNYILFFLFLTLLVPGIFIGKSVEDITVYKNFAFYMSGEFCFIFAITCLYKFNISKEFYFSILKIVFVSCFCLSFFIFLVSPSLSEILFTTEANFDASGGFGPNQVSTILGIGLFSGMILLLNERCYFRHRIFDILMILFILFRILLTFSRGGVSSSLIAVIVYLSLFFVFQSKFESKQRNLFFVKIFVLVIVTFSIYLYVDNLTEGILTDRFVRTVYSEKSDEIGISDSRVLIIDSELESFKKNIFFGAGVGGSQRERYESSGVFVNSHNELSRLLGDHGLLGLFYLFALSILFFRNLYFPKNILNLVYLLPLICLVLLNLSHSGLRLSITSFLCALSFICLINIKSNKT